MSKCNCREKAHSAPSLCLSTLFKYICTYTRAPKTCRKRRRLWQSGLVAALLVERRERRQWRLAIAPSSLLLNRADPLPDASQRQSLDRPVRPTWAAAVPIGLPTEQQAPDPAEDEPRGEDGDDDDGRELEDGDFVALW